MSGDVTFVLCIERNAICAQALLLCESIRRFGGRHRAAPIVAVAPRAGLGVDAATQRRLRGMDVEYVEEPLNRACPEYGSANRVVAAAWTEQRARSEWIVVLDSDTVFVDEPALPADIDVLVRPVDEKGSASEGPGDPFEGYWSDLAELQGLPLDGLPFVRTTVCGRRVRASYNGGLVVVRRELEILRAWSELFSRSVALGLRPWRDSGHNVHASTGFVGIEASEFWGSNQAALALAIWSRTSRVALLPDGYNVPLHAAVERTELVERLRGTPLVHLHYHWLFADPHPATALAVLAKLGMAYDRLDWLKARLPLQG